MNVSREIGLQKIRACRQEIERTAERDPIEAKPKPIFVRNADVWFPPPEAQCWRAYQRWIMEQVRSE